MLLWCIFSRRNRQPPAERDPSASSHARNRRSQPRFSACLWPIVVRFVAPARRPSPEMRVARLLSLERRFFCEIWCVFAPSNSEPRHPTEVCGRRSVARGVVARRSRENDGAAIATAALRLRNLGGSGRRNRPGRFGAAAGCELARLATQRTAAGTRSTSTPGRAADLWPAASARISVSPFFDSGGRGTRGARRQWSRATRESHGDVSDLNARFEPNAALDHKSAARPGVLVLCVPVRCVASRASSHPTTAHGCPKSPWPVAAARATQVLQA